MTQMLLDGSSRIDEAIRLLREHEPEEGYYLAFSGGKDSIIIFDLAKKAGVKFDAHYSMTTIDPPEVMHFIRENYPTVVWEHPMLSFFKLIEKEKMLPTRKIRFCCRALKEIGGKGRVVITGIRKAESVSRRKRHEFEESRGVKGKFFLNPILEWSTGDVWDYIRENKLKYCSLYDQGKKRIGCLFCPMQGKKGMEFDRVHYPKYFKALLRSIQRMLDHIRRDGGEWSKGKTPLDVWNWWIGS
jgi:phosphoadenosine phosphosulfate reductase